MAQFDFVAMLQHDQYNDSIKGIDKTNPGYRCESTDKEIDVYLNDKLTFVRFAPGSDTFCTPSCANPNETYYQVASVPQEFKIMPKAEIPIRFHTPKELQDFLNNVGKYQRGQLKIDNQNNT